MKTNEIETFVDKIISEEIKKTIIKESHNKHVVYHIMCDDEPVDTKATHELAEEVVDLLKKEFPGKQFIIEKKEYKNEGDMIEALDKMGEDLEHTENMTNDKQKVGDQGLSEEKNNLCECGTTMNEDGVCPECSKKINESKKRKVYLKESELIKLISKMVNEASVPGLDTFKKVHTDNGKQNKANITDVTKKVKPYSSDKFPEQNKGEKIARQNTKEEDEEVAKNFAGLQNLEYETEPSEQFKKRADMAINGDSTMGNAPTTEKASITPSNEAEKGKESEDKSGNVIATPQTAKKIEKQVKDRAKDKEERVLYKKEKVPVSESKLENELNKMRLLTTYNKKTQ